MSTLTTTPTRRSGRPVGLALGAASGVTLAVAGVWHALIEEHVTVAEPPTYPADESPARAMAQYYHWYADSVVPQDRAASILALAGVVGLVLLADGLRRRAPGSAFLLRASYTAIGAGGVLWLVGGLIGVGADRAVGLMATHANPIDGVNSIAFTFDMVGDAFSAAALILLGVAMIVIGIAPVRAGASRWAPWSGLTGVLALVVAFGYVQGVDALTTYVLAGLALLALPVWTVWAGRLLDEPVEHGDQGTGER